MWTMAKLAAFALVAAGIMSLISGFSLRGGFHVPPARPNVIHTTVRMYNPPPAHWPKAPSGWPYQRPTGTTPYQAPKSPQTGPQAVCKLSVDHEDYVCK